MSYEFHLPDLAEGMTEAEVVDWKVKEGDTVDLDQPIVEVMSDKATVEIPSPRAGTVVKLNYGAGDICEVGHVLFVIDEGGEASDSGNAAASEFDEAANSAKTRISSQSALAAEAAKEFDQAAGAKTTIFQAVQLPGAANTITRPEVIDATVGRKKVLATPATRKRARQAGIDLRLVPGTGRIGRVTNEDLQAYQEAQIAGAVTQRFEKVAPARAPISIAEGGLEERIPFRGMRKRISENMVRSAFTATHFTYVEEVDTGDLVEFRNRAKTRGAERGIKLTYLPFIVKAVVAGLKRHPSLNSSLDESTNEIVLKKYYHIGIATQGPQGLTVAVVRNADKLSIFEIAAEIERISTAVQNGTATREDLTGSTFTISSLGKLGGLMATPIINFPEVGILGVHKMEQRPVVVDGEIVPRWRMNLSISLDHRLVDGYDGAIFVQDVKSLLEDPTLMFMEMV